jgi:glyoxylase-like metal-dependent hydrolase (beta-lactamase superfamily II)
MDAVHDPATGVTTVDTGFHRPRFDAAYLVESDGEAAFIDCGTNHSVPRMLQALASRGLAPGSVTHLVLTHVHLDHAGGAGALMRELPAARLVVHPRGAPHMIDPGKLIAGATAVYGEAEVQRSYGRILPVDAGRVEEAGDGHVVRVGRRTLTCLDAPGHARHHIVIHDPASDSFFTGDTFGLSYREFDVDGRPFALPTTTPVQFEPEALVASIRRMLQARPAAMHVTHFGRIGDVQRVGADLVEQVGLMVALARQADGAHGDDRPARHRAMIAALSELYLARARAHGVAMDDAAVLDLLGMDIELNAQGMGVWLDRGNGRGRA